MSADTKIRLLKMAPVPNTAGMTGSEVATAYKRWENQNAVLHFDWLKSHIAPQQQQRKVAFDDEQRRQPQPNNSSAGALKRFNSLQKTGSDIQEQIDLLRYQLRSSLKVLNEEKDNAGFKKQKVDDAMAGWKRKRSDDPVVRKPEPDAGPRPNVRRDPMN